MRFWYSLCLHFLRLNPMVAGHKRLCWRVTILNACQQIFNLRLLTWLLSKYYEMVNSDVRMVYWTLKWSTTCSHSFRVLRRRKGPSYKFMREDTTRRIFLLSATIFRCELRNETICGMIIADSRS